MNGAVSKDVKIGCNAGDCGACTVLVDGAALCACLTPTLQVDGASIETAAGLAAEDPSAQKLKATFQARGAAQCGICTPGMLTSAVALLRETPSPTEAQAMDALGGVLCRCTGYRSILEAVVAAGNSGEASSPPAGVVGDPSARIDGARKVDALEVFGDDVASADALVVRVLRSPYPRARFEFGDLDAFVAATPGLEAVVTAADVPGLNRFGVIPGFHDQPVFAEEAVRHRGEAVGGFRRRRPQRCATLT